MKMEESDRAMLDSEIPDYVCCVVTESVWTWFLTIILSVMLFAMATLRYCKRYLGSEKYVSKNQHLLARQLVRYFLLPCTLQGPKDTFELSLCSNKQPWKGMS